MGCCEDVCCLPCKMCEAVCDCFLVICCCPCRCCCGCPKTSTEATPQTMVVVQRAAEPARPQDETHEMMVPPVQVAA